MRSGFACLSSYTHSTAYPTAVSAAPSRHSITPYPRFRNINLIPISYAVRPHLRGRLTLRRLTLLRKPWACGVRVSHPHYRYSCRHGLFRTLHKTLRFSFDAYGMLSYHACIKIHASAASVICFSPDHLRCITTRPVSCYALFQWWLLLSQHPGCLCDPTSFPT